MGYETNYDLEIVADSVREVVKGYDADGQPASIYVNKYYDVEDFRCKIREETGYSYLFTERCKWYEHEEEMRSFSRKYPNVIFILSGAGEEQGDLWKKYFKNGKMQIALAKITYDEFDERRLS